ncbi:MAG: response regulator, partial [Desulfamplus sp.]|nr:response regulator [Desulfamplus sp.]
FRDSIKNLDIRKAKDLLLDLHLESEETKIAVIDELAVISDDIACLLLDFIIRLEAKYYKSYKFGAYDRLIQLITDRAHLNFDFAIILYKVKDRKKILQASSLLKFILTSCTDREILFETINAVGAEKIESLVPAIGEFLYYDDATLKEQAVKNLAKIANSEVYKILFDISKTVKNDQNIMNALALFTTASKPDSKSDSKPEPTESELSPESESNKADFIQVSAAPAKSNWINNEQLQSTPFESGTSEFGLKLKVEDNKSLFAQQNITASQQNIKEPQQNIKEPQQNIKESQQNVIASQQNVIASQQNITVSSPLKTDRRDIKTLGSNSIEERFEALNYFLKHGSDYLKELIVSLKSQNHDILLNTLRILSNTASEEILPDIYSFLNRKNSEASLEHQAFEALYSFDKFSFTELMMSAVEKPAIHVRISAIKALNKNYNDPVYAKIKNRIETGREQGEALVHTIIDAHADKLINYLMISDTFAEMASNYLIKDGTPSALNNYLNILISRGLKSTANKIAFKADMDKKLNDRFKAMVISASDTVQKIYEKLLFKNGYISIEFKNPEDAFEFISTDKPDLIVSDLFLMDMTALDFAKEIREFYSGNELPFLISTQQKDFLDINLTDKYADREISGIFKFPGIIKGIECSLFEI